MSEASVYSYPVRCDDNLLPGAFELQSQALSTWDGGLNAYLYLLGYLANIWEKTCNPTLAEQVFKKENATGEGYIDSFEDGPDYLVSGAIVQVKYLPPDIDMVFGSNPTIYAGTCAFMMGEVVNRDTLEFPVPQSGGIGLGAVPGKQTYGLLPRMSTWGDQRSTGMTPTAWGYGVDPPFVQTLNAGAGVARMIIGGAVSKSQANNSYFPIQWINFRRSYFVPAKPNATGFWWHLKKGVIADIYVFGKEQAHAVSHSQGGEGGSAGIFNPIECGRVI